MKNILFILAGMFISSQSMAIGQAAEIFFSQDSVASNKIYLSLKTLTPIYQTGRELDSVYINWGDGTQSFIYLSDSIQVAGLNYPLYDAIYKGSHTYDSSFLNSLIVIGYEDGPRIPNIVNINQSQTQSFYIRALLNFNVLKNITGYVSPHFVASLYKDDTIYRTVTYNPIYHSANALDSKIRLVNPLAWTNGPVPYMFPNQVDMSNSDTLLNCDTATGLFFWDHPSYTGHYDITYEIVQYQNNELVSSIMQDMLITVFGSPASVDNLVNIEGQTLSIYPSPTSSTITIDMSGYDAGDRQVHIYDQLGQLVYQSTTTQYHLLVEAPLASGIYTVEVTHQSRREYARFVRE